MILFTSPNNPADRCFCPCARLPILGENIDDHEGGEQGEVNESKDANEDGGCVQNGKRESHDMISEDDGKVYIPTILIPLLKYLINSILFRQLKRLV